MGEENAGEGARPGCKGLLGPGGARVPLSLAARALEHLPGGNGDKGGFMSKGKEAGRPSARAGRPGLRPLPAQLEMLPGEG